MNIGPSCPHCGDLAGTSRLFWGVGKPFDCGNCGATLIVHRGFGVFLALAGLIAVWRAGRSVDGLQFVAFVMIVFFAVALLSFLTMKPKLVSPESRD